MRTVVGIVGDVKHMGLDADEGPAVYQPYAQKPEFLRWMTVVVRTGVEPTGLVGAIRGEVAALDPDQPIFDVAPPWRRGCRARWRGRASSRR
jgi:putative ABC transport system permease protein